MIAVALLASCLAASPSGPSLDVGPLSLGLLAANGRGGTVFAQELSFSLGLELDARWSVRLVGDFAVDQLRYLGETSGPTGNRYTEAGLTAMLLHAWPGETWTPFVGAGIARRELDMNRFALGLPSVCESRPVPPDCGDDDEYAPGATRFAPELWGGLRTTISEGGRAELALSFTGQSVAGKFVALGRLRLGITYAIGL